MSLVGYRANNHPQQIRRRGANADVDERATDPLLFAPLDERFRFTLDVAAQSHNTKCASYFTPLEDGLEQPWSGHRVWCNPPYSNIPSWVEKAWAQHQCTQHIVMLLPANRTEQAWWQDMVEPYRDRRDSPLTVEFMRGRPRFIRHGQSEIGPNERPPFGCCLLIWRQP